MDILESIAQCVSVFLLLFLEKEITVIFIRGYVQALHKESRFVSMWKTICPFTCLTQIYEALVQALVLLIHVHDPTGTAFPNMKNQTCLGSVQIKTNTHITLGQR